MPERIIFRIAFFSLVLLIPIGIYFVPETVAVLLTGFLAVAPIWLPLILTAIAAPLWITYIRSQYVSSIPYTMLELKPGEDTPKSARAAELIFYSLYHRVEITRRAAILTGQVRLPWSFEIAATGGTVRFFVRIPTEHRSAIESRIRAEYRDVDLDETRDYARDVGFNAFSMRLTMREYTLAKPDAYPLKTYDAHEPADADPLHALLESLVAIGEGERLYLSWIVKPHQQERPHLWAEPVDRLTADAQATIESLVGSAGNLKAIPEARQKVVHLVEAALKKPAFDVGVRSLYMADRDHWNEAHAAGLETLLERFGDNDLNSFVSADPEQKIGWPLSDIFKAVPPLIGGYLLNLYRRRAFFAPPYYGTPFVLNTAELATVYHLPHVGRASALGRASGMRLEPPDNLPVVA